MSLSKQKFREIILQALYSFENNADNIELISQLLTRELLVSKKNIALALSSAQKIYSMKEELDEKIKVFSISYDLERIQQVTRNILRIAVYELLFDPYVPPKVTIAEAIRLSRKFASPESADFVNGLLDAFYKASQSDIDKNKNS